MRALGVIPARGGSKGLPGKNLRLLGGRPLLALHGGRGAAPAAGCRARRAQHRRRRDCRRGPRPGPRRAVPAPAGAGARRHADAARAAARVDGPARRRVRPTRGAAAAHVAAAARRAHRRARSICSSERAPIRWCRSSRCRTSSTRCRCCAVDGDRAAAVQRGADAHPAPGQAARVRAQRPGGAGGARPASSRAARCTATIRACS